MGVQAQRSFLMAMVESMVALLLDIRGDHHALPLAVVDGILRGVIMCVWQGHGSINAIYAEAVDYACGVKRQETGLMSKDEWI